MSFDPYQQWFRIKPAFRDGDGPPDHYTLLGVRRGESDPKLIHEAALRRMQFLRRHQAGARGELTQRLMNEVSQAERCLIDSARKAQYDFELEQRRPNLREIGSRKKSSAPVWLSLIAALLVVGGGASIYFAVKRNAEDKTTDAPTVAETPKAEGPTVAHQTEPVVETPPPAPKKELNPSPPKPEVVAPKPKDPPPKPALVKLRDLPAAPPTKQVDDDVVHLASIATDADEEAPTFLDREGRWLGFQRKVDGRIQMVAAERASADGPFVAEHLVQGLPEDVRRQGFAMEPGELSCIFAASDGKGLFRAVRKDRDTEWGAAALLLACGAPVNAVWPTLTADGKELFGIQTRSGKQRVLHLVRGSVEAAFGKPEELTAFGNALSQPAVSPDGKILVLRGPEMLYVAHRNSEGGWPPAEPVLSLRASAGANRALIVSPCFSPDGKWLLFAGNQDGSVGGFDLWMARASMLKVETPNLKKLAEKQEPKTTAKEKKGTQTKVKGKLAAKESNKGQKKPAPALKTASDAKSVEAIDEWLVLGPLSSASPLTVRNLAHVQELGGAELLRKMPKDNDEGRDGLTWTRATQFDKPGVYFVVVHLRLKSNSEARMEVVSAPGGGVLWLNGPVGELSWGADKLWTPTTVKVKGEPLSLIAGRNRIVGVVCVSDQKTPLVVRLVNAEDGEVLEGVSVSF